MRQKSFALIAFMFMGTSVLAQSANEKLALAISGAEDANLQKLKAYIWKRKSDVAVGGVVKLTTLTEFSFDAQNKLQAKLVDAESSVQQKRGLRGRAQKSAIQDKAEYVQKALELSIAYTFMTKGQLMDFFTKATVTESNGVIEATGENIYVQGDKLTIRVDKATNLFVGKKFSSLLGKDSVTGEINYGRFDSGVSHGSTTVLNLPAQKMTINATNQDYAQKVN
jgi:hypothetical protein